MTDGVQCDYKRLSASPLSALARKSGDALKARSGHEQEAGEVFIPRGMRMNARIAGAGSAEQSE
ncbi:hypothetical protein GCWU000341_00464 [Oribacterium sp. oral taxon 078 str. F0262]|nr:hypothetical protein GCWU000341_00464 [Oribacterium sp. oral taxon 078 str. F0262]